VKVEGDAPQVDDIPEELIITFRKPIALGSETYTQMILREPTAGELVQTDKVAGAEADALALTLVSGLPRPVIDKMGARDFRAGSVYLGRFLS
jgi:hypothetical protein